MDDLSKEVYQGLIEQGMDPEEAEAIFGSLFDAVKAIPVKELPMPLCPEEQTKGMEILGLVESMPKGLKQAAAHLFLECDRIVRQTQPIVPITPVASNELSLVLLLSDWHFGKVVEQEDTITYNRQIRRARVEQVIQKVLQFKESQKDEIDELVIGVLGDMADGSEIYPAQGYHQEETSLKQGVSAAELLWQVLITMSGEFKNVRMHCVPGNHGRASKTSPADQNWDYLIYLQLYRMAQMLNNPGLQVQYKYDKWIDTEVKGRKLHLRHKAPPQAETAAAFKKFSGYHDRHKFDIMCYGHLHHPALAWHQDRPLVMCGSLIGSDDLSEEIAVQCRPMQVMFTVPSNSNEPIAQKIPIYLD